MDARRQQSLRAHQKHTNKRARSTTTPTIHEQNERKYAAFGNVLLQILADGTPGMAVGCIAEDGSVQLDESPADSTWQDELCSATLVGNLFSVKLPKAVLDGFNNECTRAGIWPGALDAAAVNQCREELRQLESEGTLRESNHGQPSSTRGDAIAFVTLDGESAYCEQSETPALRKAFSLLESAGAQLAKQLGYEVCFAPPFGMAARYHGEHGYVRHLDNELIRVPKLSDAGDAGGGHDADEEEEGSTEGDDEDAEARADASAHLRASAWRNFRVVTCICYLNEPGAHSLPHTLPSLAPSLTRPFLLSLAPLSLCSSSPRLVVSVRWRHPPLFRGLKRRRRLHSREQRVLP